MNHSSVRGRLAYLGPEGHERGREWFHVTIAPDGSRTMRSVAEIDDSEILRDVTLTVGPDWRPAESYVRVSVADLWVGTAWFRFDDRGATAEIDSPLLGQLTQRLPSSGRAPMFGAHQVAGDGWQAALLEPGESGPRRVEGILISSPLPNGASAPMLASTAMVAECLGPEQITTPAGAFDTLHFRFTPDGLGAEDVWVLPQDLTLVRSVWGHYGTTYELVELSHPDHPPTSGQTP
ncbi:hypothetical protein [Nocardioides gilvus]|uniref:hypothetical protein n=1 Tax=Nocardioides gilvus TaxID=1735589 RepID=UPI000D74ABC9|nr:hypothetical protein [Nocardioides gilvus]